MVFVVGEALVKLGACQAGEGLHHFIDRAASPNQGNKIMNPDPGSLDDRVPTSNPRLSHNVPITGRDHVGRQGSSAEPRNRRHKPALGQDA